MADCNELDGMMDDVVDVQDVRRDGEFMEKLTRFGLADLFLCTSMPFEVAAAGNGLERRLLSNDDTVSSSFSDVMSTVNTDVPLKNRNLNIVNIFLYLIIYYNVYNVCVHV